MELTGKHLIAGAWIEAESKFNSTPAHGEAYEFSAGSVALVDQAVQAAEDAFLSFSATTSKERAAFLNAIADEIDVRIDDLAEIGTQETGLPEPRLRGETGRTTGQLRLFASHILDGSYLDQRHDEALPDRAPLPRSDLRMMQRPVGPVAVFGASNFPLAFSTAGGDTASALAAGCPVVVRGHHAHPGTAEVVAAAVKAAVEKTGVHPGVFSLIQGGDLEVGQRLVQHPLIKAVGFTGSLGGGRALFDLCAQRPEPIPFFGELGSINPMFLLPAAASARAVAIGTGWAGSLTMGAGQFCTNPGVVVVLDGPEADAFKGAALEALQQVGGQVTLTSGIAAAYHSGQSRIAAVAGVETLLEPAETADRSVLPSIFEVSGADWLSNADLAHEVFGPLGIIVSAANFEEMQNIAKELDGQLTCTLHLEEGDAEVAKSLLPILERKAGRILANGFPTGVEVSDAMVHGGPYPASTNFGATSVGTMAIRRFLRPVCYQDLPDYLIPSA
ncbi:aldehyde dehydrogenase (NADP(+)) [Planktotalea sp.]|uniref:aldehyde dehydrogenase (NADP(+)) n=1 Tax=Planktotalea sp. TaxID=2029877 RepID=UPI00329A585E